MMLSGCPVRGVVLLGLIPNRHSDASACGRRTTALDGSLASLLGWGQARPSGRPSSAHARRPEECQECNRPSNFWMAFDIAILIYWVGVAILVISQDREPTVDTRVAARALRGSRFSGLSCTSSSVGTGLTTSSGPGHQAPARAARGSCRRSTRPTPSCPRAFAAPRAVRTRAWSRLLSRSSECRPFPYAPASCTATDRSTSTSCSPISLRRSGSST